MEAELLTKNPCTIKGAASAQREREPVLLSVDELAAVADAIKPERFKAMVLLSLGARCDSVKQLSCSAKTLATVASQ